MLLFSSSPRLRRYVNSRRHVTIILFARICLGCSDVEPSRFSFSIADCFHPLPSDSVDELRIWQACLSGCEREVFVVSENGIRVRLDEVELVFGCQAQIDSRVAIDCQQSVNLFTVLLDIS